MPTIVVTNGAQVYAWEIADQLLLLNFDVESSYFAAQTMQSKVCRGSIYIYM